MARRRRHNPAALARSLSEIATSTPIVIAQRSARFASSSAASARRHRENARMVVEKPFAFAEAWFAAAAGAALAAPALAFSCWRSYASTADAWTAALPWQRACLDLAGQALAPFVRRTRANARRLGRRS